MESGPKQSRCCLLMLVLDAMGHGAYSQCYDIEVIPVVDCGILGVEPLFGEGMNESSQVAGWRFDCFVGPDVPAAWLGGRALTTLPLPPTITDDAKAFDINAWGDTVGSGYLSAATGNKHSFAVIDGIPIDLGTLPGDSTSEAAAINNALQIVGTSFNAATGPLHAYLWQDGTMSALDLPHGPNAGARDISESGEIVGWMGSSPVIDANAFLWTKERVIDLGVIPGGYTAEAAAISNTGAVVGAGIVPDPDGKDAFAHAFYWCDGAMIDLGTLPGFSRSFSLDVNDSHTVVGQCTEPAQLGRGFIWRNGVMTDLNDLIDPALEIHIGQAKAINNTGQVLVRGNTPDGTRSIILTPKNASATDLTADCLTGMTDLMVLLDQWGPKPPLGGADFNADGIVNAADLAELLANWG